MEEKNIEKNPCEKENKKISKRYLAFYIIGLFSVALVLILLSYVTQFRADKQLASLNSELAQKNTTVQGVQEKLLVLQDTVAQQEQVIQEQEKKITEFRTTLNMTADEEINVILNQRLDERDAYYHMVLLEKAADDNDEAAVNEQIKYLSETYGAGRLDGSAADAVFTGEIAERYIQIVQEFSN